MNVGDYVVYIKNGDIGTLGQNKKDIWAITEIIRTGIVGIVDFRVESLSKPGKVFDSSFINFLDVEELRQRGKFHEEFFVKKAYDIANGRVSNKFTESKKVNNSNMVKRTVDSNVDAAKVAAKITAGKTLNNLIAVQLRDRKVLPMMVRGYADTAFGAVVIANIADFAVKQFAVNNRKARIATDAMMQAAMVELMEEFDFEGMINDLLSNVNLEAVVEE